MLSLKKRPTLLGIPIGKKELDVKKIGGLIAALLALFGIGLGVAGNQRRKNKEEQAQSAEEQEETAAGRRSSDESSQSEDE